MVKSTLTNDPKRQLENPIRMNFASNKPTITIANMMRGGKDVIGLIPVPAHAQG